MPSSSAFSSATRASAPRRAYPFKSNCGNQSLQNLKGYPMSVTGSELDGDNGEMWRGNLNLSVEKIQKYLRVYFSIIREEKVWRVSYISPLSPWQDAEG